MGDRTSKRRRLDYAADAGVGVESNGYSGNDGHGRERQQVQGSFASADEIGWSLSSEYGGGTVGAGGARGDVRAGISRFKDFLTSITRDENVAARSQNLKILREYCQNQTAASREHVDFPDLLASWSSATQSSNDSLSSAIPAVLAQFFRTISGLLEFRDFGLSLCHSLLKRDQLRLFDRGLSAPRSKEHLISPCLRLLTEIISFDGGTLANNVYARRDFLFKRLDTLLDFRQSSSHEEPDRRKPSVRRMALRVVIAALRFLEGNAKNEFVTQQRLIRSTLRGLLYDGDDIVLDVIRALESGVFEIVGIPRNVRSRFFNQDNLVFLANLYIYEADSAHPESASAVREAVHGILLKICTSRKGICNLQNGWYPLGYDLNLPLDEGNDDDNFIDLGLDSPLYLDNYKANIPIRNSTLASVIQSLKPDIDTLQAELLLAVFKACPELVADYFSKKKFSSTPGGDDALWRGQFAFLFGVTQLPMPQNLGYADKPPTFPPPTSIVIESLIPRPLDRSTLTRCFSLNDELLIISGSRFLSMALNKTELVLRAFSKAGERQDAWRQASQKLVQAVLERCPRYKDIIEAFQRSSKDNEMLCTVLFECIATIHRVLPEAISLSKFDVGPLLANRLAQPSSLTTVQSGEGSSSEQIMWLVQIARDSPATRWWTKSGADSLSLFTMLLQFVTFANETLKDHADNVSASITSDILRTLESAISSTDILYKTSESFQALCSSLMRSKDFAPLDELFLFLDNAIHRAVQKPVRYLDRIEKAQQVTSDKTPLGLLACSVAEQWGLALRKYSGKENKHVAKTISKFIARYFSALEASGQNIRIMTNFREEMEAAAAAEDKKSKMYLVSAFEKVSKKPVEVKPMTDSNVKHSDTMKQAPITTTTKKIDLAQIFGFAPRAPTSLKGLVTTFTAKTDIEQVIRSDRVAKLILATASSVEEIRLSSFAALQQLTYVIDAEVTATTAATSLGATSNDAPSTQSSTYSERAQVHLLLGELCETIRYNHSQHQQHQHTTLTPLPGPVAELAARLLQIISDPSHRMFSKANRFLLRGPRWDLRKLIPYWIDRVLFHEPEADDSIGSNATMSARPKAGAETDIDTKGGAGAGGTPAWTSEVEWLLLWLNDGIKTADDIETYRRSGAWEKILTLYAKPGLAGNLKRLILCLVWRTISVGHDDNEIPSNGANTLITRAGVHSWLRMIATIDGDFHNVAQELRRVLLHKSDDDVIRKWEGNIPCLAAS